MQALAAKAFAAAPILASAVIAAGLQLADSAPPKVMDVVGGAEGDRTPDLYNAIVALSQLSYGPNKR